MATDNASAKTARHRRMGATVQPLLGDRFLIAGITPLQQRDLASFSHFEQPAGAPVVSVEPASTGRPSAPYRVPPSRLAYDRIGQARRSLRNAFAVSFDGFG